MKSIAVFNNKGGVGKSTLTLLVADFFASTHVTIKDRPARVLVVDLDAQGSSATALVGPSAVADRQAAGRTVSGLLEKLMGRQAPSLADYLIPRQVRETGTRKIRLGKLWTLVSDGDGTMALEDRYRDRIAIALAERLKPMLEKEFDIVLFDLPANIDRRNYLAMAALGVADFILTPTEPTRMTINAMEKSFSIIRDAQGAARQAGRRVPKLVGVVLNKTDRRTRQYRLHARDIEQLAGANDSLVFRNFLPAAPTLASATDDSIGFETLRERYDSYYDHVRKVAKELAERCGYSVSARPPRS